MNELIILWNTLNLSLSYADNSAELKIGLGLYIFAA